MSPPTSIVKLDAQIQPYAWGSHTAIAEIQGRPTPTDSPEAELWIGDHPNGPSRVVEASGTSPLAEWCAARRADVLGPSRRKLPYLVKIVAAAQPLSIQLHPNAQQAAEGYAREEAAGIARGDVRRSYSDSNPKVETLCALDRFEALCGLRSGMELCESVAKSRSGVAAQLLADADDGRSDDELSGAFFLRVLRATAEDPSRARQLAEEIARYGAREQNGSVEAMWINQLAAVHPGDPTVIAPLALNYIALEPGDSLEVPPNTVHCYLSGTGVEVMTSSDNVIRGGLTRKHIAQDEFARLLDTRAGKPRICQPVAEGLEGPQGRCSIAPYPLRTDEFRISRVRLLPGDARVSVEAGGAKPRILLCVRGALELVDPAPDATVSLSAGEAALIPACVETFEMEGDAEGFLVEPG